MIGHIYRIIHLESDIQYVGSTFNEPRKKWQNHKQYYREWLSDKCNRCVIYTYFRQHGIDKFKLIPMKSYGVQDRTHLEAYEQLWINKLNCVNMNNPFRITKMHKKQYATANKDNHQHKAKQWRESNKAKLACKTQCECGGEYCHTNNDRHQKSQRHPQWLTKNS
ncbi:unnamed protein product [Phytophthora lilii]|uniref:Unnamed protein product n=1 Tax=Phytophthora lilii TaxID=2077276 RepID=A0A9W6TH51_9STRA|nr:unnamed protein product [Phytophthora lilii]